MTETKIYRALAGAFVAEGVDTLFVLTGDGNMHWEAALAEGNAFQSFHVRHEHSACAMASAYAVKTGKVGVASVTCGPGLTQIMTALATAARARIPLVVFSGESPMHAAWYNQHIDQAPLVLSTGAHYIAGHSALRIMDNVRDAFMIARRERRPVVLGVPLDLQQQTLPAGPAYVPSTALMPDVGPMLAHPDYVARALARINAAERIVIVGGRGVVRDDAVTECETLADLCGALLASTLPVRGLFDHSPHSIGIAGGFAHEVAREYFSRADLVISVGASLSHHTVDGGQLFPNARVLQIDIDPAGIRQGRKAADDYLRGDAKTALNALIAGLAGTKRPLEANWRSPDLAARMDGPADTGTFPELGIGADPRDIIVALDRAIPKDWEIVNASGHCSYFAAQMRGRTAERFLAIREFGAIGNGLCYAAGVAATKPDRPVVLIDGDGGFLMHVQELETIRRHKLKILFCILNDGAFGSEIHKLRADGLNDRGAIFGRGDLGRVARGFGLRGEVVSDLSKLPALIQAHESGDSSEVWDFPISDQVTSPVMRRTVGGRK
jgi:acetolactate synthase I/II/III large subunit